MVNIQDLKKYSQQEIIAICNYSDCQYLKHLDNEKNDQKEFAVYSQSFDNRLHFYWLDLGNKTQILKKHRGQSGT